MTRLLNRVISREEFRELKGIQKLAKPRPRREYVAPWMDSDLLGTRIEMLLPEYVHSLNEILEESAGARVGRKKKERDAIKKVAPLLRHVRIPTQVYLERISPGELDPHDNLPGGFKHWVDCIARAYGKKGDSRKDGIEWIYEQATDGQKYGLRIVVRGRLI
jgi:hypothetical protein